MGSEAVVRHGGALRQVDRAALGAHALVGTGVSGIGQLALVEIRGNLAPDAAARVARKLVGIDGGGELLAHVVHRERIWIQHVWDWRGRVALTLFDVSGNPVTNVQLFVQALDESQAVRRLLAIELALQAFIADRGSPPETLVGMVPTYLPRIPGDPFSGEPFTYTKTENEHRLTSASSGHNLQPLSGIGALLWRDKGGTEPFSLEEWYADQSEK